MLAREIRTYRVASMLRAPRLKTSLPSLRPTNCKGILGRHLRLALVPPVASRNWEIDFDRCPASRMLASGSGDGLRERRLKLSVLP